MHEIASSTEWLRYGDVPMPVGLSNTRYFTEPEGGPRRKVRNCIIRIFISILMNDPEDTFSLDFVGAIVQNTGPLLETLY